VTSQPYAFRAMTAADLPLVQRWLQQPHVMEWWGDTHEQFELVSGDLEVETMDQFIVAHDDRPFGYIQCYDLSDWDSGFSTHPSGTRGIDQFIGDPDMIDRGHGSAFIRAFVDNRLIAGTPRMVTDPDPANARAIRAYEKAGFARDRLVDTPDGIALLMVRDA
jgi:aminoglycoside 6'-N-acetyltransferase